MANTTPQKPNILFFFTDDQRFDTIRALGNPSIHTPHLDRLVASGTSFTHAHIPGGTCAAVCMPSRAMLHTGRGLFQIAGEGQSIPEAHTTLGERLMEAGYTAFGTGKWHNGRAAFARSFNAGAEIFFGGMEDHWNVPVYDYDPSGRYARSSPFVRDPYTSNQVEYRDCDHVVAGKHSTDLFVDAAIDFLHARERDRPFFMYLSLMAPHDPRTMPRQFLEMYDPEEIQLPENFLPQHPIDTGALRVRDELLAPLPRDPGEMRRHSAEYYAMISHLDHAWGRLLAALEEAGERENTLLVFSGDNGLAIGQHGLMGKQNLYDHSLRVPLIFAGPGVAAGERRDAPVYLFDIFPTLCDLVGLSQPDSVRGHSLLPCLADPQARIREGLYLAYGETIRGVRQGRYKLIEYVVNGVATTQLFDRQEDPSEIHNLARHPEMAAIVGGLREEMFRLRDEWEDERHPTGQRFWSQYRQLQSTSP